MLRVAAVLLAGLLLTSAARAADVDEAAIQRAETRGAALYAYDQAAWAATDDMLRQVPDIQKLAPNGWVVEPKGDALTVTFFHLENGEPSAVFVAEAKDRKVVSGHILGPADDHALSAQGRQLAHALQAASPKIQGEPRCSNAPFNSVVLPPETANGPVAVYALTPQMQNGVYPGGGHYRIEVDASGAVIGERKFMNSCFPLEPPPSPNGPPALFVTHLLDPQPTEIHVYLSLWTGLPIYVMTVGNKRVWQVDHGRIQLTNMTVSGKAP